MEFTHGGHQVEWLPNAFNPQKNLTKWLLVAFNFKNKTTY